MTRRVHIDRLHLDISGLAPADAQAAVRLLGPALARALAERRPQVAPAERLDAGRVTTPQRSDPPALATRIAGQLAQRLGDKP